jgi:hypothetical protein
MASLCGAAASTVQMTVISAELPAEAIGRLLLAGGRKWSPVGSTRLETLS